MLSSRREKFIEAKKKAGDYNKLLLKLNTQEVHVYFSNNGEIHGTGYDKMLESELNHATFTQDQMSIMKDESTSLFHVRKDLKHNNIYHLERRPLIVPKKDVFLNEIFFGVNEQYDIKIELYPQYFQANVHTSLLERYEDISLDSVTINGNRILTFYLTNKNDPHIMVHWLSVHVEKLFKNKQLQMPLPKDLTDCSIFIKKDKNTKYIRMK